MLFVLCTLIIGWGIRNAYMHDTDHEIELIHNIDLLLLTFGILYAAWTNLDSMNKTSAGMAKTARNDFLLRFDNRYCNKESLEVKTILHRIYLNTKKPKKNYSCSEKHIATISDKVKDMAKSNREQDIKDFIILINFLDSLETIAYFVNNNDDIKIENIEEFLGQSIIYYYLIFITWIYENLRIDNRNYSYYSYYSEFEELVKKLSKKCKNEDCQKHKKFQEMALNKLNKLKDSNSTKQICDKCGKIEDKKKLFEDNDYKDTLDKVCSDLEDYKYENKI